MFGQLGSVVFEGLYGPDVFRREAGGANHAVQDLIENKPRLQRVGSKLQTLSLSIKLMNSFVNPEASIAALESSCNAGEILPLILGNGRYIGDFVIDGLAEEILRTDRDGNIVEAVLDLTLLENAESDPVKAANKAAMAAGFAMSANKPTKAIRRPPVQSPSGRVLTGVSQAKQNASKIRRAVDALQQGIASAGNEIRRAKRAVTAGIDALKNAEKVMVQAQQLQTQAQGGLAQIRSAQRNFERMGQQLQTGNLNSLIDANRSLQFGMSNLSSSVSPLASYGAARKG